MGEKPTIQGQIQTIDSPDQDYAKGDWNRDANGKVSGTYEAGGLIDGIGQVRRICYLIVDASIPQKGSEFSYPGKQLSSTVGFAGNHITSGEGSVTGSDGTAAVHYEPGNNGGSFAVHDKDNTNFINASYLQSEGKVNGSAGLKLDDANYAYIDYQKGLLTQAKASFKPSDNYEFAAASKDGGLTSGRFKVDEGGDNVIDLTMPEAAAARTTGRIGIVGERYGFFVNIPATGDMSGYLKHPDKENIVYTISIANGGISALSPDIAVDQTVTFESGNGGELYIKKELHPGSDGVPDTTTYEVSGNTTMILQGGALAVAGVTGYVAWQLEKNGFVTAKRNQKLGAFGTASVNMKVYKDGTLEGTASADGSYRDYTWKVRVTDGSKDGPTVIKIDAQKAANLTASVTASTDRTGSASMTYQRDNLKGTIKYAIGTGLSGSVTWNDPERLANTVTMSYALAGKVLALELTAASDNKKFNLESAKIDSKGQCSLKLTYKAKDVDISLAILPDGACTASMKVSSTTPIGDMTWEIQKSSKGGVSSKVNLKIDDAKSTSLACDENGKITGTFDGKSGDNTMHLAVGGGKDKPTDYTGSLNYHEKDGPSGTVTLKGSDNTASLSADVTAATDPEQNYGGVEILTTGKVKRISVGIGSSRVNFGAKYLPLSDEIVANGHLDWGTVASEGTGSGATGTADLKVGKVPGSDAIIEAKGSGTYDGEKFTLGVKWTKAASDFSFSLGDGLSGSVALKAGNFDDGKLHYQAGPKTDRIIIDFEAKQNGDSVDSEAKFVNEYNHDPEELSITTGVILKDFDVTEVNVGLAVRGQIGNPDVTVQLSGGNTINLAKPGLSRFVNPNLTAAIVSRIYLLSSQDKFHGFVSQGMGTQGEASVGLGVEINRGPVVFEANVFYARPDEKALVKTEQIVPAVSATMTWTN